MIPSTWPAAADEAGWAAVVEAGCLDECPPGPIAGAVRALHLVGDARVVNALALELSRRITRRLRQIVGTGHPNRGEDIIERAHGALILAVLDPRSEEGESVVEAFFARVRFRGIDAIRVERTHHDRFRGLPLDGDGEQVVRGCRLDGGAASADATHVLHRIADFRKRLAFSLSVEGLRVGGGDPSIASVLGRDPRTIRRWIAEARAILAAEIGAG